jgi:hypothetical protein
VDTSDIGVRGPDPRGFVQGDIWLVSDADIRKIVSDAARQRPAAAGEELIYLVLISQDPIPIVTQHPNANGYHDTFDDAGTPRVYGVVLNQAARIAEAIWLYLPGVFAHELVEASTDPDVKTGYVLDTGDELCDMNKTQTVTLDGLDHPVELALYWSELEGAAVAPTTYSLRIHLGVRAAQTVASVRSSIPGASVRDAILAGCNP